MMILMAMTRCNMALLLVVDKEGEPVNITKYYVSYIADLTPIAFVDGLDDLTLVMRSL